MQALYNNFVIIVPVYNAKRSIALTLNSIFQQEYDDLGIIIRDDMSTDRTPRVLFGLLGIDGVTKKYTHIHGRDIIYIRNDRKFYGGGNTYDSAINYIGNKNSIVGVVDGDDRLIDKYALMKISRVYAKQDKWLVWSQHRLASALLQGTKTTGYSCSLPPDELIYSTRDYWAVSHFRTSRAWLFDLIKAADLLDPFCPGSYCKLAADAALLYPMIELCGNSRSYFLDECLYLYDDTLDANESRLYADQVWLYTNYIRSQQKRYSRLAAPFQ